MQRKARHDLVFEDIRAGRKTSEIARDYGIACSTVLRIKEQMSNKLDLERSAIYRLLLDESPNEATAHKIFIVLNRHCNTVPTNTNKDYYPEGLDIKDKMTIRHRCLRVLHYLRAADELEIKRVPGIGVTYYPICLACKRRIIASFGKWEGKK